METQPIPTPPAGAISAKSTESAELAQLRADVNAANARADEASKAAAAVSEKPARFAVYDKTYLKYLPGVHDTRPAAEKAAKDAKVKYRIDEV